MTVHFPLDYPPWRPVEPDRPVQRLDVTGRRTWVVGDIHGMYDQLQHDLDAVGFDPGRGDRLIAVGDLIDRGPRSDLALDWLSRDDFKSVRGNHDEFVVDAVLHDDLDVRREAWDVWMANGGAWARSWLESGDKRLRKLAKAIRALPIALDVRWGDRRFGIVHGNVPETVTWDAFLALLESGDPAAHAQAIWGRSRAMQLQSGHQLEPIEGLDRLFHGHTPLPRPMLSGNTHFIDTGAVYGKELTLVALHEL